jgi:predicted Rossmann fold nucleotide-binding protein DprA/Smf involved in DNA uptake
LTFCELHEITLKDLTLVSGIARGVDEVFAFVAMNNDLKLILSIPASVRWHKHRSFSRNMIGF